MTFPINKKPKTPAELKKAFNCKEWRMANLYKIVNKEGKLVTFKMNKAQADFMANKHGRDIVLKSRQLGFTTLKAIDGLDNTLFKKHQNNLFIAHTQKDATEIFDNKVDIAWKNIPKQHQRLWGLDTSKKNQFKFELGDGIISSYTVSNSGRSGTFNDVHISEFAKMCAKYPGQAQEIITGTIPAVPTGGTITIESTAEGDSGEFSDMYWQAAKRAREPGPKEFKAHFYNWQWDAEVETIDVIPIEEMEQRGKFEPIRNQYKLTPQELTYYYTQWLALNKDWNNLKQEYPITAEEAFVSSGVPYFDAEVLDRQPIIEPEVSGAFKYFKPYNTLHNYVMGCDVAHGVGRDSSTIVVLDVDKSEVVATYENNTIDPAVFAHEIARMAKLYGSCLVGVEMNMGGGGHSTIQELKTIYPGNLIYHHETQTMLEDKPSMKLGWHTTSATKPAALGQLAIAVNEELFRLHSQTLIHEMKTFPSNKIMDAKHYPDDTRHWDMVIALMIAWAIRGSNQAVKQEQLNPHVEAMKYHAIQDMLDAPDVGV